MAPRDRQAKHVNPEASDDVTSQLPSRLCKYTPFSAAQKIVSDLKLQWSSVLLFNDPFEEAIEFTSFKDSIEHAAQEVVIELMDAQNDPVFKRADALAKPFITLWRQKYRAGEYTRDDVLRDLQSRMESLLRGLPGRERAFRLERMEVQRLGRVLSLSEPHDDLLMWAHYADYHKGVVIEFDPSADSELSQA